MQPKDSLAQETFFATILGGIIGFAGATIILLLEMGGNAHEPFIRYWFVLQPPAHALTTIISFIIIGCLGGYLWSRLGYKNNEIATLKEGRQDTREFMSLVTHQMKTPLSSLLFSIDMLLQKNSSEVSKNHKEFLQKIYGELKNLLILTQDLSDFTKLELGRLGFALQYTSLREVEKNIRAVIQGFMSIAKGKGITLSSSFSLHGEKSLQVDLIRINQAIGNLLENAIVYTPTEGKVSIHVKNYSSSLLVSVSDTGIGIPQGEQGKIFSKFFRASNARKERSSGTGIGLYLCKQIIKTHLGEMWFVSKENKGTTFYISLPLAVPLDSALREVNQFLVKI